MSKVAGSTLRGILLAGGRGTRLYPLTSIVSKQLQPIYNKPMIYYSLTTLIRAGVREVLLISTRDDIPRFQSLMGDGRKWGLEITYVVQEEPRGVAEALILGESFIADGSTLLMLGDNVIYGRLDFLREAIATNGGGATVFAYQVRDPSAYGVVDVDDDWRVTSIEEKPANPRSSWAVVGLYVYGPGVAARARSLAPSPRGELEITDLNRLYLSEGTLRAQPIGRGIAWLDTGTADAILDAANFVHALEARQGLSIGCPEEAAYREGFLSVDGFRAAIASLPDCTYRHYLERVLRETRK